MVNHILVKSIKSVQKQIIIKQNMHDSEISTTTKIQKVSPFDLDHLIKNFLKSRNICG